MTEETNNSELIIQPEQQEQPKTEPAAEQHEQPQPTTETNPEPNQEENNSTTKQQTQEKKKMNLSELSTEELEAELKRRKNQAQTKKEQFVLNEEDASNLAEYMKQPSVSPLPPTISATSMENAIASYPGKLTKFAHMQTVNGQFTKDKSQAATIYIISVSDDYIVNETLTALNFKFSEILEKI